MASVTGSPVLGNPTYPTSDGKPMAKTDWHRELMTILIPGACTTRFGP